MTFHKVSDKHIALPVTLYNKSNSLKLAEVSSTGFPCYEAVVKMSSVFCLAW